MLSVPLIYGLAGILLFSFVSHFTLGKSRFRFAEALIFRI